ncbi:MAG: c-type cytochrome, partial [Gammaproteobacteria bacterium]
MAQPVEEAGEASQLRHNMILETIYPKYPEIDYGEGDEAELIKHGEYLTKVGDCIACHTDMQSGGEVFAGGLPIETPFGTLYTTNITPDKETGLGNWNEADFFEAMRHGKLPDGRNLFPVFPYPYFNKLSTDDLRAIWTYFRAIPPINKENIKMNIPFPLNWRLLQYGWKMLFFYPNEGPFEYDPSKSKEWNRGAYLVESLGHCSMCHTPWNVLGAPKRKYYLTGNFIDGFWAPNITSYGLKSATHYEVAEVFATGELLNRAGPVAGPMADVNHNSLGYLTEADGLAIATYLKSVKTEPPYKIKPVNTQNRLKHGRQVYINVCITCHQRGEAGAPRLGDSANWERRTQEVGMDALYRHTINGYNNMPIRG